MLIPSSSSTQSGNITVTQEPKLPKIAILTFNGELKKFPKYKDLMLNFVHDNPDMTNVQKIHYLQLSLADDAAKLIRDFKLCDTTYSEGWSAVLEGYDNKRMIIADHLASLFSVKKA